MTATHKANFLASPLVHPTAIVEEGVHIGAATSVWDGVHIRNDARIGAECIIGERTYIGPGVQIGNRVRINAFAYICSSVTIEDGVMVSAGVIFTNDRYPRATTPDLQELRSFNPGKNTAPTLVKEGATIGAGSRIGAGLIIGRFAMIGMGSVVTKSLPDFALVVGSPACAVGYVCRCGQPLLRFKSGSARRSTSLPCDDCQRSYDLRAGVLSEVVVGP
jgi:acetyltransferase-like isoleucine patch superfamily enzyme